MKRVVVVADKVDAGGLALLEQAPGLEVLKAIKNPSKFKEALPQAQALLVRSETKVTAELLAQAPQLRVIGRAGIGVDNIDLEEATRRGIAVFNAPGGNTVSAAEHTVGLLLALVRKIPWADASMRTGEWDRQRFLGTELRGKTLGIVGLGRIGAHVATLARAFGMAVLAYDPYLTEGRAKELQAELVPLDELLQRVDVVTLHLPLTKETKALIDRRRIGLMKPSAVLLNCARGGLVDEPALLQALEQGKLAGAAIDVFETEPLPADSPLRSAERVILTPHLAASTAEAQELVSLEICRVVRDALVTGNLSGAVNLPGVSGAMLARLEPLLDLARRLGRFAAALSPGRVEGIEVHYGGTDQGAQRVIQLAAIEGALGTMGVGPVTLVNAAALAEGRGIALGGRTGAPEPGFETTVEVTVRAASGTASVVGALAGEHGHIVRINGFAIDIPPDGHILVLRNRDVPGVIGRVGTVLGEARINIGAYHLSRRTQQGQEALGAVAVDQPPPPEVLERLSGLPDVLDVRLANLNGVA
ncbi:MAG: phosphoglycerate dehydrogenase [Gemmatimonadetes bacterium]|nr:phosphoglycerate dehydrogenase [Gemmatimonadota bacterium]